MKFFYTFFTVLILSSFVITGCQKDSNFLIKEEAFSVITSGFNGSNNELQVSIDTMTLEAPIPANRNFKINYKYTFPAKQDNIKLTIREKETGIALYEKEIKRGDYSLTIEIIYANGKLLEKPVAPAENPENTRLVSYLFIPSVSSYSGDIDIAYLKTYSYEENGYWKFEKEEVLARMTAKPYAFSEFLRTPVFQTGETFIDGKRYLLSSKLMFYKSGTNIPYYEAAGITIDPNSYLIPPNTNKPQIVGVMEWGTIGTHIVGYEQVQF